MQAGQVARTKHEQECCPCGTHLLVHVREEPLKSGKCCGGHHIRPPLARTPGPAGGRADAEMPQPFAGPKLRRLGWLEQALRANMRRRVRRHRHQRPPCGPARAVPVRGALVTAAHAVRGSASHPPGLPSCLHLARAGHPQPLAACQRRLLSGCARSHTRAATFRNVPARPSPEVLYPATASPHLADQRGSYRNAWSALPRQLDCTVLLPGGPVWPLLCAKLERVRADPPRAEPKDEGHLQGGRPATLALIYFNLHCSIQRQ